MQDNSAFLKRNKTNFTITINLNGRGGRMTIAIGRSFWWVATPPMQQVTPTRGIRVNVIDAHGGAYGGLWVESLGDFHKSVVLQEKQDLKKISGGFLYSVSIHTATLSHQKYRFLDSQKIPTSNLAFQAFQRFLGT